MMEIKSGFRQAIQDYFGLLEKRYPQKAILRLVGDRYKLSRTERNILYRGVASREESLRRKEKLIPPDHMNNQTLHIDALNQLYPVAAYLNGDPVFLSTDGLLRDAAAVHGTGWLNKHLDRAMSLTDDLITKSNIEEVHYFVDEKVNHSHEVASKIRQLSSQDITTQINLSRQVDQKLRNMESGIIATSDSQVIDRSQVPVFDLARHVLTENFSPDFFNLDFLYHK